MLPVNGSLMFFSGVFRTSLQLGNDESVGRSWTPTLWKGRS